MTLLTPRQVVRRVHQSIADWPAGRTDGTLAVLWSLAAWAFVIAAIVLAGILSATPAHVVDADLVQDLVEDDKSVIVLAVLGLVVVSWLLVQHRVLSWRMQRNRLQRESERPPVRILVQPDPAVVSTDRPVGGLWLYLMLLVLVPTLGA